ncbi:MAG: SPASM domain-containing protein [SAR324 cluster bacterium]|nr:SPASM domain-containing protein [SAR324 cluster bacterium]
MKKFIFNRIKTHKEKFPRLLSLELSSICNANCIMCPHGEMTRKKLNMPIEILEKVVADCKGKPLKKINLFWFGDSLCNNRIIACLEYIRRGLPRAKLNLSTNAGLLTEEKSRAIIDGNLVDVINFDIDGIKKATFEKIRQKLDFDQVVKNVRFFLDHKKSKSALKPETRITIINMAPTEKEIPAFIEYWKPLVDKVEVNKYNTWLGTQEDRNVGRSFEESSSEKFTFACKHPWDELVIAADGRAGLCCLDFDLKAEVGNVKNQTVKEIWNSAEMTGYRNKMLQLDYDSIDVCRDCNAHIFQKNGFWARIQQ